MERDRGYSDLPMASKSIMGAGLAMLSLLGSNFSHAECKPFLPDRWQDEHEEIAVRTKARFVSANHCKLQVAARAASAIKGHLGSHCTGNRGPQQLIKFGLQLLK